MTTDYCWISTSLFCPKEHWNRLLKNGIRPFLGIPSIKKQVTAFQVKLNYNRGGNIRLALLTPTRQAVSVAQATDVYFKDLFQHAPFSYEHRPLPPDGLFCDFPANSIQYGLYRYPGLVHADNVAAYYLETQLSRLIIQLLCKKPIDDDEILTLVFYFHIAWLKTCMMWLPEYTVNEFAAMYGLDTATLAANNFNNSQPLLTEMYTDIIHSPVSDLPGWLQKWMKACTYQMDYEKKQGSPKSLPQLHQWITQTINSYLALPVHTQQLLFHCIKQMLCCNAP